MTKSKQPTSLTKVSTTEKEPNIIIIKKATTRSLEGRAPLAYHVGKDEASNIHVCIHSNGGGGFHSSEWLAFADIQQALTSWPEALPITSMALRPLFRGKSVNTPSFLLAALVNEGILDRVPDKKRHFQLGDPSAFLATVEGHKKGGNTAAKSKPKSKAKTKTKTKTSAGMTKAKKKTSTRKK